MIPVLEMQRQEGIARLVMQASASFSKKPDLKKKREKKRKKKKRRPAMEEDTIWHAHIPMNTQIIIAIPAWFSILKFHPVTMISAFGCSLHSNF